MKLHTRTVGILIFLMAAALSGLVGLQYVLMRNAIELKEQAFERNVYAAMNAIGRKLETAETVGNIFRVAVETPEKAGKHIIRIDAEAMIDSAATGGTIVTKRKFHFLKPPLRIDGDRVSYDVRTPQHVTLRVYDALGKQDTVLVDTFREPGEYAHVFDSARFGSGEYFFKLSTDSLTYVLSIANGRSRGSLPNTVTFRERQEWVGQVMENLTIAEREPVERRIRPALLDSVVRTSLAEAGIDLPYGYGVTSSRGDSLRIVQPASMAGAIMQSEFRSRLFPSDFLLTNSALVLHFPDRGIYLFKQIAPHLALSAVLIGVIIFCFVYTIRTILRQKQFSLRLVEFINNMTHEFKTPISTISVAAETMMRPEIIGQPEKLARYGGVIQDENTRMKKQVDTILQMAVLEDGDYELRLAPIDVHDVILNAAANITLQVESRGGAVACRLDAASSVVNADAVHLANIIHNLLDNATKYSPEAPRITVATRNAGGNRFVVSVADCGIGIGEEDRARVFDKYYRVPTGNRHDVKGFGLGLSYVKLMMSAHGGEVSLESEPGTGTTVTLEFPVHHTDG